MRHMSTHPLPTKPHYLVLDGLRGVAALIVVIFHVLEAHSTSHLDLMINHGYLAVDFFFLLSGYVIGYAYDDRWQKMSIGTFFKRRLERLQPMVIMGMIIGAIFFYASDSPLFPAIHTVPVWKLLLIMLIGFTLIPIPVSWDIRGWQEMHPLDGPAWSLFFEYVGNILYALGIRKLSKSALSILVGLAAIALIYLTVFGPTGDVIGGWSITPEQLGIGFTRLMFPFFAGLLLSRATKPTRINNAFLWCGILLTIVLAIPRIGGADHLWMNGIYESFIIILVFPLIVYLGASGQIHSNRESKICKFLADLSYPLYITHYPFIYVYTGWVSAHKGTNMPLAVVYGILTFVVSVLVGYLSLKYYDEPVRAWLKKKVKA